MTARHHLVLRTSPPDVITNNHYLQQHADKHTYRLQRHPSLGISHEEYTPNKYHGHQHYIHHHLDVAQAYHHRQAANHNQLDHNRKPPQ